MMKARSRSRKAFTLIELLVVMVVVAIISGISFKLWGMATRSANIAATVNKIERLQHACEEYKAEYGQYPPTTFVAYTCEWPEKQHEWLRDDYFYENPDLIAPEHGLAAYLWPRNPGGIYQHAPEDESWNEDTPRDSTAKKRWFPFIKGIDWVNDPGAGDIEITDGEGSSQLAYSNRYQTVRDAWERDLQYRCTRPFQSYVLWSKGPDGQGNTRDDINRDRWDN